MAAMSALFPTHGMLGGLGLFATSYVDTVSQERNLRGALPQQRRRPTSGSHVTDRRPYGRPRFVRSVAGARR